MKTSVKIFGILCAVMMASGIQAAETIKVASVHAKTGKASEGGSYFSQGIRFAVEEVNQQGGLIGKQLELFEFDNKSTPIDAKKAAREAVDAGVSAVIGAIWSSHSLAMAPTLQSAKIPMISPGSTNPNVTLVGDYIFRSCFIDSFQGKVMADFAIDDLQAKTAVALINSNSSYSVELAKVFIQHFQDRKGKFLWQGHYLDEETDFSHLLDKIKMVKPHVSFVPGYRTDSALIIKQARKMGLSVTFLGGDAWGNDMYNYAKKELHGNYYSDHWHRESPDIISQQFVKRYEKKYGKVDPRNVLGYDAAYLLADAIRRADSAKPGPIRDALARTRSFRGVTGNITLDHNGDPVKSVVILKFDKGTVSYVKTIEP